MTYFLLSIRSNTKFEIRQKLPKSTPPPGNILLPRLWPKSFTYPETRHNKGQKKAKSPFPEGMGRQTPSRTRAKLPIF